MNEDDSRVPIRECLPDERGTNRGNGEKEEREDRSSRVERSSGNAKSGERNRQIKTSTCHLHDYRND